MDALRRMGCDVISELPDALLTHILCVLSKSWRFLWIEATYELNLNAVDFLCYEDDSSLVSLLNRSFLRKFKIKYDSSVITKKTITERGEDSNVNNSGKRVMEWIAEAVHLGVEHIDVENETCKRRAIIDFMPKYLYVSNTLVSLSLVNVGLEDPKFEVSLPCLKSIELDNVYYMEDDGLVIMERLISGSPVLENLTTDVPVLKKTQQTVFREAPWCLKYVKINKLTMKEDYKIKILNYVLDQSVALKKLVIGSHMAHQSRECGIEIVNYFLENSAALKKMTLSFRDSHMTNLEAESYKKLLTSTKLSPMCLISLSISHEDCH